MIAEKYSDLLETGIEVAQILSSSGKKTSILYEKVAEILYEGFHDYQIADQIRLYVIKQGEEVLEEEIFYNSLEGLQPGYDSIPFYQLPDQLLEEEKITLSEDDEQDFILVPLFYEGELIGMMELRVLKQEVITEGLLHELEDMATVISLGLSQMIFKESNLLYKSFFNTALEINEHIQSINSLKELVSSFMELTAGRLKFDRVTVFIFTETGGEVAFSRCYQARGREFSLEEIP
ncbi:MAG: hypothetical protein ACOC5A_01555 [Halanaerobiales bacterium]